MCSPGSGSAGPPFPPPGRSYLAWFSSRLPLVLPPSGGEPAEELCSWLKEEPPMPPPSGASECRSKADPDVGLHVVNMILSDFSRR